MGVGTQETPASTSVTMLNAQEQVNLSAFLKSWKKHLDIELEITQHVPGLGCGHGAELYPCSQTV